MDNLTIFNLQQVLLLEETLSVLCWKIIALQRLFYQELLWLFVDFSVLQFPTL